MNSITPIDNPFVSYLQEKRKWILQVANMRHEDFPQYRNYFNNWRLAEITDAPGAYKSGSVFAKGQYVLCSEPGAFCTPDRQPSVSVFDPTLGNVCQMDMSNVQYLT